MHFEAHATGLVQQVHISRQYRLPRCMEHSVGKGGWVTWIRRDGRHLSRYIVETFVYQSK